MQRMICSTGLSWDAMLESNASLSDLDAEHIGSFVSAVKANGRLPMPKNVLDREVLQKLELIKNDTPTRAALLLFSKNPEIYFSSAFLKMGRFRSLTLIVDDREAHGTLMEQLDAAMHWFRERLETEFIISGEPQREVRWEYPLEALREAVTNAICHRDYTSLAHSQIRLYDESLEIWNAGSLLPPLTPLDLLAEHDSIPRNRKVAEAFFYAGFIERWGSGTLRIAEELKLAGLPAPEFESSVGRFRLIFNKKIKINPQIGETKHFSVRELQAIAYVKQYGRISNAELQSIASISKRTATRDLNELIAKGVLVAEGETGGRGTTYRLKEIMGP